MRFETESGSVYEVDEGEQVIRITKKGEGHESNRVSRVYKPYEWIGPVALGNRVLIQWPDGTPPLPGSPPGVTPCTLTTRVVRCD